MLLFGKTKVLITTPTPAGNSWFMRGPGLRAQNILCNEQKDFFFFILYIYIYISFYLKSE